MATITSANSVFQLAVTDLYPVAQKLQGYAADDAFVAEAIDMAEVVMGVDGHMSAGFVFAPVPQTITIMPDSPSLEIFEAIMNATQTAREVYRCNATIVLPAIGRKYSLKNGVLTRAPQMPGVRKTLQPVAFTMTWEKITAEVYQ